MTLNEIGFVIVKPDGSAMMRNMTRRVRTSRYSTARRLVYSPGTPWKSWAEANKANHRVVRKNIDGKRREVVEQVGEIRSVCLTIL